MKVYRHLVLPFVVIAFFGFALAGVYFEQQTHMDAFSMMGQNQPAKDTLQKMWLDTNKLATQSDDGNDMIIRLDTKKMYIVKMAEKSYQVADLPLQFPPEMAQMMSMMKFEVDVKKTGETRTIGSYSCECVVMTMTGGMMNMKVTVTSWCTKDIKIPLQEYFEMYGTMMSINPSMKQIMEKMKAVDAGFPVESDTTTEVMGSKMHMTTKLIKLEMKAAPPSVFEPPAGFKSEPLDFMKMMQRGR